MPDRTQPWEQDPMPGGRVVCPVTSVPHTGSGTWETASGRLFATDVEAMRDADWSVGKDGFWHCPAHRDNVKLVLHETNPFCVRCGSTKGGMYGHVLEECKA